MITIKGKNFYQEDKPFFYLADTCWSAFTNITDEEWDYYLDLRATQGFNTLQINILPQWDASGTSLHYHAFEKDENGIRFDQLNAEYFEHAKAMGEKAVKAGFQLALVVLWCNYVPDTWASNITSASVIPYQNLKNYFERVHTTFSSLNPFYIISGDTDFLSAECIKRYCLASDTLRQLAPDCIQTFHIKGRLTSVPEAIAKRSDFVMYQSGHNAENLKTPFQLAMNFYELDDSKPIINSEPCYEQMGYSRKMYGRWNQYDVRRAAWLSLLSGAGAGVTYGAHGIYSWHKINKSFGMGIGEGFDAPNPWNDALLYPGAWDYGYIKYLFQRYQIKDLIPVSLILNPSDEIRCAKTQDGNCILIYLPVNTNVRVAMDGSDYEFEIIDLDTKRIAYPKVSIVDAVTTIPMHKFASDALIVMVKK